MGYRFLTKLLWPVLFLYTLKIAIRDNSVRYLFQRLGFNYPRQKKQTLWIHCASVGEANTYLPLHLKLLEKYPDKQFVITTNTTTGAQTVKSHKSNRTSHCYLPIESSFAIKSFLHCLQPERCLIMETEIWPLLYLHCHKQNIPINIINARLSHRTLGANRWIKSIYNKSLNRVDKILCKSELELNHFLTLGATADQLVIAGNLKFTSVENTAEIEFPKLLEQPYCVAASTHNNEEQQLAELWSHLRTDRLLVIVPRHPNRSLQIQKQLAELNIHYALRSQKQSVSADTQVYLADTLGELAHFMVHAEFVFIGGSLIKHGGQNLLEPARLGKAVICGPHMFNFIDEVDLLLRQKAIIQVQDTKELAEVFENLLKHPDKTSTLAQRAKNAMAEQSGILDSYLKYLP